MSATLVEHIAANAHAVLEPLDTEQYYRMMEMGVIREGAPIELIDGLLVRKDRRDHAGDIMTIGTRHVAVIRQLVYLLTEHLKGWPAVVQSQQPLDINSRNAPEPDVSVLDGKLSDFVDHHPRPDEVPLVIEVADSSLGFDLGRKCTLYRDAGIFEYWVVNLQDDVVELFRNPQGGKWQEERRLERGEVIETNLAGQTLRLKVDEILGPPV